MSLILQNDINYDKALRSLMQKAVRRGDSDLVEIVFKYLYLTGSKIWLRHRVAVISAEECWPLCSSLEPNVLSYKQLLNLLLQITSSGKNKSAAGLGSLSYELSQGDKSVLNGSTDDIHIKIIAAGIERPSDYWSWAKTQCANDYQIAILNNTKYYHNKGGLPWDRAFFIAASYLSLQSTDKPNDLIDVCKIDLPIWAAFDKHTKEGRTILKKISNITGIQFEIIQYINFYSESCKTNISKQSYWWDREMLWRLSNYNLNAEKAYKLWDQIKPLYLKHVLPYSNLLECYLNKKADDQLLV